MKKLLLIAILLVSTTIQAQKSKVLEGDWKNLKGISAYNLEFEYENLEIPKYDSEEDFLKDKMAKREEKEPGAGERFKKAWFADREEHYEPKFAESFNKRWDDKEVVVGRDMASADYTMKIQTTFLYPGYNVGVMRQNSKVDAIISVYKNDAPDTILFSVKYTKAEGNAAFGNDYDSGVRVGEAYAKMAKTFAKELSKKAK
ncbi:hypothetical protein C1T31_00350 [Hanstruepera neustonica]|uniref:DUF4468 domain-containing protein n=1 Tax=Hanstruepera neustonica TaxID=1445657 RepID=A0A2K1E317_9FLAO|nr:hypothetical protein [Hanstruepera neustonica]PNQ74631.1 hypothetical protein C1T31_00350 [Hanstruepera neustonica]